MPIVTTITKRILLTSLLVAMATPSLRAQPAPTGFGGETNTTWPGITLKITDIIRIDSTHALATVGLWAGPSAPAFTTIGSHPTSRYGPPPNATRAEIESSKYSPTFFSLTDTKLIDESTSQQFQAAPDLPEKPYLGPNRVVTTQARNTGILLAVLLNVPKPQPPGADGKIPPQVVTIMLPKSRPIEHVVLPTPTPGPTQAPTGASTPVQPTSPANPR